MFGGIAFLADGHMFVGVLGDGASGVGRPRELRRGAEARARPHNGLHGEADERLRVFALR
jgi:hypothetical protein